MTEFSDSEVRNVFLYIADAVRWEALPESVAEQGRAFKTVAASVHTPTSFASIVTGLYPPQHGVNQFGERLNSDIPSLFSLENTKSAFANTINERFNDNPESKSILDETLATTETSPDSLRDIEPPFVFVERGPGGHAPYGGYSGDAWEYFRERKAAPESIFREEYHESIERDREYFESRMNQLEERALLDDTLVIYTSDHGELLGEGGCLGHNAPIHPELAYVPTVFFHPSIKKQTITDNLLRHVDLFPTIVALLDEDLPDVPGRNLTSDSLSSRGACFYKKSLLPDAPIISGVLSYESVWDDEGGYVHSLTGRLNRSVILAGKLTKSAKREYMRRHFRQALSFYFSGTRRYGTPEFTVRDSMSYLNKIKNLDKPDTVSSTLNNSAKERLRELGYLR